MLKSFALLLFFLIMTCSLMAKNIKINAEYIKTHYPDVYKEIFERGKLSAKKSDEEKKTKITYESDINNNNTSKANLKKHNAKQIPPNYEWWEHSSLSDKYVYSDKFLTHFDVSYSYTNIDGNTEGFSSRGKGNAYLRWGRWTNHITAIISRRKISQAGGNNTNIDYKLAEDFLRYDLNKFLYFEGGIAWEKDSPNAVDNRYTLLGGIGAYLVDNHKFNLNVLVGGGWQKEEYDPMINYYFDFSSRDSFIYYFYEILNWFMSENLVLREGFRAIRTDKKYQYFGVDSSDNLYLKKKDNKELYKFHMALEYLFNKYFSIIFSENINYDSLPWPEVKKRDEMRSISIKFRY